MSEQSRFSAARVGVVLLGVLPLLYALSIGPVVLLVGKHDPIVIDYVISTYYPWVFWLACHFPVMEPLVQWYLDLWAALI